jgi:hypothetical protein
MHIVCEKEKKRVGKYASFKLVVVIVMLRLIFVQDICRHCNRAPAGGGYAWSDLDDARATTVSYLTRSSNATLNLHAKKKEERIA